MPRLFRRSLSLALCLAAVPAVETLASAQTVALPSRITRLQPLRTQARAPYWINYADCMADDELTLVLTLGGPWLTSGAEFQAWAGTASCADRNTRVGTAPSCWLVYRDSRPQTTGSNSYSVTLRAQDLVARLIATNGQTPSGVPSGTSASCKSASGTTQALSITFLFANANGDVVGTPAVYTGTGYDITPPAAPSDLVAKAGETRLHLSWKAPTDADIVGYRFYCDPPPGTALGTADGGLLSAADWPGLTTLQVAGDAGTAVDAGTGGTTASGGTAGTGGASTGGTGGASTGGTGGTGGADAGTTGGTGGTGGTTAGLSDSCDPSSPLAAGEIPDEAYYCGEVSGKSAVEGTIGGLVNGTQYTVAVAAVDKVENVGRLSPNYCKTPEEVTDFFELYRMNGGKGGGGLCSVSHRVSSPAWSLSVLGLLAAGGLARRRARPARRPEPKQETRE